MLSIPEDILVAVSLQSPLVFFVESSSFIVWTGSMIPTHDISE
jgi:hypothetical protein